MNNEQLKMLSREEKEKLFIDSTIRLQKYWWNYIEPDWWEKFKFETASDEWLEKEIIRDIRIYNDELLNEKNIQKREKLIDLLAPYIWYTILLFVILWIIWLLFFWIKQLFQ